MTGAAGNWDQAVFVALGANLSAGGRDCVGALDAAMAELERRGVGVLARSRPWRSAAWPDAGQPPFVNAVAWVEVEDSAAARRSGSRADAVPPFVSRARQGEGDLDPTAFLALLHDVEAAFGRRRGVANAARTLDLDLIAYGRRVEAGPPVLPHPRAAERLFVMGPLAEIAPDWRDPISGLSARALAAAATVGRDAAPCGDWPGVGVTT